MQTLTFRLYDSLPAEKLDQWRHVLSSLSEKEADLQMRKRIQDYLDAGHGQCFLARPEIARMVEDTLLFFDLQRYELFAWVVMPNHVHALLRTMEEWSLSSIFHSWRSYSSHEANRMLGRHGRFWQPDYHDRYIRDERHFDNVVRYIEMNPVKAGLCRRPEDWLFGSARRRKAGLLPRVLIKG